MIKNKLYNIIYNIINYARMNCSRSDAVKIRPGIDSIIKTITKKITGGLDSVVKSTDNNIGKVTEDAPKLNLKNITPQMWFLLLIFVVVVANICKCKSAEITKFATPSTTSKSSFYYY